MEKKSEKSIEEQVEDQCKLWLAKERYFVKNASINPEIDEALEKAPSKSGGKGHNYPDIKLLLDSAYIANVPVMIEVKGKQGLTIK